MVICIGNLVSWEFVEVVCDEFGGYIYFVIDDEIVNVYKKIVV